MSSILNVDEVKQETFTSWYLNGYRNVKPETHIVQGTMETARFLLEMAEAYTKASYGPHESFGARLRVYLRDIAARHGLEIPKRPTPPAGARVYHDPNAYTEEDGISRLLRAIREAGDNVELVELDEEGDGSVTLHPQLRRIS